MKRIILVLITIVILFSFVACDFFTTSWGTGLQRDLGSLLKKESTDDLAKLASDPNYKGDSKAAASLLNALSGKNEAEIQNLSSEERNNILDLALTATLPMDAITNIMDNLDNLDNLDPDNGAEIIDILSENITEFDTRAVVTILNNPLDEVDTDSLVSASVAVVAQVVKRKGNDLDLEDIFEEGEDGKLTVNKELEDDTTIKELEAVLKVYDLFKDGERSDEDPSFLGFNFSELFGGDE